MKLAMLFALAACGGAPPIDHVTPAALAQLPMAASAGVIVVGDTTFVFDRERASVIRGGVVVGRAAPPKPAAAWEAATALVGPEGVTWAVGLAGGAVWRVTTTGEVEAVGDRLGVGGARVLSIAATGSTFALGLADGFAASRDGLHVLRFPGAPGTAVAAATDVVAVARDGAVEVDDLALGWHQRYPVDGVTQLGFLSATGAHPHLVVAARGDLFVQERGALRRQRVPAGMHEMAVAGDRIWLLGTRLAVLDHRALTAIEGAAPARIYGAPDGDVWAAGAQLSRYTLAIATDATRWQRSVAPIFARGCAKCHLAGGAADLDLSTAAAWAAARPTLRGVLSDRTMPPSDAPPLADADRAALQAWVR